ncbi:MAG: hypothetical protein ACFB10_15915 [Salibacteraceae bacterium]|mgnify:CR=1 FL=1
MNKDSLLDEFQQEAFSMEMGAKIIGGHQCSGTNDRCTDDDEGCCDTDPPPSEEVPITELGTISSDGSV